MSLSDTTILDRMLEPVTQFFTPEVAQRLLDLRPDAAVQTRIDELGSKANEGSLSAEETTEYEDYVEAVDLIGILRSKARAILARHTDC